jgi:hypothetical protein
VYDEAHANAAASVRLEQRPVRIQLEGVAVVEVVGYGN